MRIDQCKTTDEFLHRISEIEQSWAQKVGEWAFVGDNSDYIVMIHQDNLDKEKFKWKHGKVIPLTK